MDKKKVKVAILAIASVLMISATASAILADIAKSYSHVDQSLIPMVLTLPSLLGMIFSLLSGPLSTKMSKRNVVLFGLISALIGGAMAFLIGGISFYALLIASVLIGVGQGINSTMSMALIADYFAGEERSTLMGLQSAFVNFGAMVILLISGLLAGINWRSSYLIYLIMIPVIFLVVRGLPNEAPPKSATSAKEEVHKLNGTVYFTCLLVLCYGALLFVFQTNVSLVISTNHLGNATSSGFANSFMVAIGALTGFIYKYLKRTFKSYLLAVSIIATALGMFLIFAVGSLAAVFVAAGCAGFGLSIMMPTVTFRVSAAVHPSISATAIALVTGASNIGMFMSPFIISPIAKNIGQGDLSSRFLLAGIALLVLAIVAVIGNTKFNKTQEELVRG